MIAAHLLDQILGQLEQVRVRRPELRFGQLVAIIGTLAEDETGHSLWDVEDPDFAAALERFAADLARSETGDVEPDNTPNVVGVPSPAASTAPQPRGT